MATTPATSYPTENINLTRVAWLAVPNGNDGAPIDIGDLSDRTIQITGTFGTGGSLSIEGSNDGGTTWATLTDPLGNNLTFTAAGMKAITELPQKIRPRVTAGDGTTSLNAHLFMKGTRQ